MGGNGHRARVRFPERRRPTATAVTYTRIDSTSTAAPQRFVSGIVVDPTNADRAWVTYSGYNANTPATPGHVFQVDYDSTTHTATWTNIDNGTGPLGDLPVTGIAPRCNDRHALRGHGLHRARGHAGGKRHLRRELAAAAGGLPQVEVAGVTLDQKSRTLYAATHGRAIWSLSLQSRPSSTIEEDEGPPSGGPSSVRWRQRL